MKSHFSTCGWPVLLALAATAAVQAALVTGGIAYTKQFETNLRDEPNALANVSSKVAMGTKVTIQESKGIWLRVTAPNGSGWVFNGLLAEKEPEKVVNSNGPVVVAAKTTATAAARGLSDVATAYASRRDLELAKQDLDWLEKRGLTISRDDVDKFLREQKKGEFQ